MWSVGCIFGEFLKHGPLLPGQTEASQVELIFDLLGTPNDQIWPGFSGLFPVLLRKQPYNNLKQKLPSTSASTIALLNRFLTYDPAKRITAAEALRHAYFSESPLRARAVAARAAGASLTLARARSQRPGAAADLSRDPQRAGVRGQVAASPRRRATMPRP